MPPLYCHADTVGRRAVALRAVVALFLALALCFSLGLCGASATAAVQASTDDSAPPVDLTSLGWVWPAERSRVSRPFVAPAHEYGPGHRGIDLDLLGDSAVRAPADGVVAFAGGVAGRGILTIDHGDGLVTTLEPVDTVLVPGTQVQRGQNVATLAAGGHTASGELHFGVRLDGKYTNPMLLLGGIARAILLPCCE